MLPLRLSLPAWSRTCRRPQPQAPTPPSQPPPNLCPLVPAPCRSDGVGLWLKNQLKDVVSLLNGFHFTCYVAGGCCCCGLWQSSARGSHGCSRCSVPMSGSNAHPARPCPCPAGQESEQGSLNRLTGCWHKQYEYRSKSTIVSGGLCWASSRMCKLLVDAGPFPALPPHRDAAHPVPQVCVRRDHPLYPHVERMTLRYHLLYQNYYTE